MNTFELETIQRASEGTIIEIKNFEETLENAKQIIENNPVFVVTNDTEKKQAKEIRANFNKVIKAVKAKRISDISNLVSVYEDQCKQIESLFDEAQKRFGDEIKTYEEKQKDTIVSQDAKVYTATITFTDAKMVDKLTTFCEKNNLTITIK